MKISLVINTYNRMKSLPIALHSIEYLRYPELEVIVVDGPSDDGTMEFLQAHWSGKVKICKCEVANLSVSRNIGIANSTGDIVAFIDDDGMPEPDWLDQIASAYQNLRVGAVGGWVRNHTGVEYQTKYIVSSRQSSSEVLVGDPDAVPACRPNAEKFPGLIGVNSSFRRSALLEVGGFDELYAYFLDETDVLVRLVDAGYHIACVPDAEVHHKYAPSHIRAENGIAKSWFQIVKSTCYYVLRNASPSRKFEELLWEIVQVKSNLIGHTRWFHSQGMIDQRRLDVLLKEIEDGANEGIESAFANPLRQLLGPVVPPAWMPFPRRKPSEQRWRIAFVTTLYPPRPCGGVAIFMHSLALEMAAAGHEVTVITQAEPGRPHTVDFEDGVWVHRLPELDDLACACPEGMPDMPEQMKQQAGRVLAEIDRVNARRKIDIVIGAIWDLDTAAVIASGRYRTALYLVTSYRLMEASKPEWRANEDYYRDHVRKMIDAESWALANATCILASTNAILADVEAAYQTTIPAHRCRVVHFGTPEPRFEIKTDPRARSEIGLLFVGRMEMRKGADLLLEALPALLARNHNLKVTCIGEYSLPFKDGMTYVSDFLSKHLGAAWMDRITFMGHVDDATLEEAYAGCDIFIAPSRYESFGLIYLEAMRFGKPCIGGLTGGVPEVVLADVTGLLVPPGDSAALEIAVQRLIDDEALRERLGRAGKERYEKFFTTRAFMDRFVENVGPFLPRVILEGPP